MHVVSIQQETARSARYAWYLELECLWRLVNQEIAYHQQEAENFRLQKLTLELDLIALRDEFYDEAEPAAENQKDSRDV